MKLYLSSYRIPTLSDLLKLVGKPASGIVVAVIPNAKDYYAPRAWEYKVHNFTSYLESLGLKFMVTDLRQYSNSDEVVEAFEGFDVIWAIGGNTFCLRYEMKRSGFDQAVNDLLKSGIVYGGDSAGAIVAGRSLTGVERGDAPEFAQEVIQEGIGLVGFSIIPHVDSAEFAEAAAYMREVQEKEGEVVLLKDSQAIVVNGNRREVVEAK